jgi:hypothetical protein
MRLTGYDIPRPEPIGVHELACLIDFGVETAEAAFADDEDLVRGGRRANHEGNIHGIRPDSHESV